jgi:DNA primase
LCGDSKKNKTKARGFLFTKGDVVFYKCHNCGNPDVPTLKKLIWTLDQNLYKEYLLDTFKGESSPVIKKESIKTEQKQESRLETLPDARCVSDLKDDHPIIKYLEKRKIPKLFYDKLYFVKNFKEYSNTLKPNCFKNLKGDHPRIIIPFYDENGKVFAFQGRALGKETPKYLTIKLDETSEKIFGLERLSMKKRIYVVEGPIDSMFIDNCVAVAGGAISSKFLLKHKENTTIIFDNEPRNEEICKQIKKCIDAGFSVCLMPKKYREFGKDINDLILSGFTKQEVKKVIDENTFSDIMAHVKFCEWRDMK